MRNGQQRYAGIGITALKMPQDTVAKFPSKIQKLTTSTMQITGEMQGLEVSAMIVWTVYRGEDGPARAYKYLGNDLAESTPRTANQLITTVT
jgi:hypothetical protein